MWTRQGWVWNRNGYAGLCRQYMPWVEVPDALLQITAIRNEQNARMAKEAGSSFFIVKPFTTGSIREGLRQALP